MVEEDTTNLLHLTCPYMYEVKGLLYKKRHLCQNEKVFGWALSRVLIFLGLDKVLL